MSGDMVVFDLLYSETNGMDKSHNKKRSRYNRLDLSYT